MSGSTATGYGEEEGIPGARVTGAGHAAPATGRAADGNPVRTGTGGTAGIGDNAGIGVSSRQQKNKGLLLTEKAPLYGNKIN